MENNNSPSLLDQILANNESTNQNPVNPVTANGIPPEPKPPKKPREPMSTATIFKLIGTLFLVFLIFMGMFLAYIVFNPDQAGFFVSVFGILPSDVANVLSGLINVSFGILSTIISIVFIVALFRAFWTPKEQKRKKLMLGLVATFSGIIFFTILGFWAFLFAQLQAANFANPNGNILVYDNDMFNNEKMKPYAQITNLSTLIGPITLRYNISDNAKTLAKRNGIKIENYEINFDGAICADGTSIAKGGDPVNESDIICTFDKLKNYNPSGRYTVTDYSGKTETVNIPLEQVQIRGLMKITEQENKDGKLMRTYDASALRQLGTPTWQYDDNQEKVITENYISISPTDTPVILHFYLDNNSKKITYSRSFIIQNSDVKNGDGNIIVTQNPTNPKEYIFRLEDITSDQDSIISIDWRLNGSSTICTNRKGVSCSHNFTSYGQFTIEATVNLIGGQSKKVVKNFQIDAPLELERHLKITDKSGKFLNPESTYDLKSRAYVIKDITPPEKIFLDARDVISDNPGYVLKDVNWTITENKESERKNGTKIEIDITRAGRYNIVAEYTFEKSIKTGRDDDTRVTTDTILLDLERKDLYAVLKINSSSDYVPARVTADASQSHSEYSEIIKFIYDFGEGRAPAQGDAIQTYQYMTPGEKTITVTIIDANGQQATAKQVVVLKDTPKNLNFTTSLSPGIKNSPVDFEATGTTGEIEDYLWNFGDNTPVSHGYQVSHTFAKSGKHTVTLTVRYVDGTEKSTRKEFVVVDSLE